MIDHFYNTYYRLQGMATVSATAQIVKDFADQVDTEKAYSLKELKDIIGEIYKTVGKPSKGKKTTPVVSDEDDGPVAKEKVKRAPSAYNNYVKKRISQLKTERSDVPPKELMTIAASEWRKLTKIEQEQYKI